MADLLKYQLTRTNLVNRFNVIRGLENVMPASRVIEDAEPLILLSVGLGAAIDR